MINSHYGKIVNGQLERMPSASIENGQTYDNTSEGRAQWRQDNGWLPICEECRSNCPQGKVMHRTGEYETVGGEILACFVAVDPEDATSEECRHALKDLSQHYQQFELAGKINELCALIRNICIAAVLAPLALFADNPLSVERTAVSNLWNDSEVIVGAEFDDTVLEDFATHEDISDIQGVVEQWESFLDGSNVVFSITNYISGAYTLDTAKLKILELKNGAYQEVYNSRDEILLHIQDFKDDDFANATNQVIGAINSAIVNKADKDWGKYTSAGGEAPENTVYMTAPNTVFAGGLEYERVAVGEGTICVLTTHGAPVWTQGDEGTFKFQDDGGTNYFGFAKTDSYTIGADTDGITVQGGMVTMNYNITMSGRPCVWYKADLTSNAPWEQLNLPDGSPISGASLSVTWEQNPPAGTQVCYINVGSHPQGYYRATVEVAGEAKFMTNMPADLEGGIFCTDGQHKVKIDWNNGNPRLIGVE